MVFLLDHGIWLIYGIDPMVFSHPWFRVHGIGLRVCLYIERLIFSHAFLT